MRPVLPALAVVLSFVLTAECRAQQEAPTAVQIDAMIRLVHSPDNVLSNLAAGTLLRAGEPAFGPLRRAAAASTDPEHARRFAELARGIDHTTRVAYRTFRGHEGMASFVAYTPDGRRLVSAGEDGTVRLWDPETGKEVRRLKGHEKGITCLTLSADGKRALTGSGDRTVRLWDLEAGKQIRVFEDKELVWAVGFADGGKRVLSSSGNPFFCHSNDFVDYKVRGWEVESGKEVVSFEGPKGCVPGSTFSPDGRWVLFDSGADRADLWDVANGAELRQFKPGKGRLGTFAFTPDGKRVVGVGGAGLWVWDAETAKPVVEGRSKDAYAVALTVSADGKRVLTAGGITLETRLWDAETGKPLWKFFGPGGSVNGVALSPDGRFAVAAGTDGTLRMWRIPESTRAKR